MASLRWAAGNGEKPTWWENSGLETKQGPRSRVSCHLVPVTSCSDLRCRQRGAVTLHLLQQQTRWQPTNHTAEKQGQRWQRNSTFQSKRNQSQMSAFAERVRVRLVTAARRRSSRLWLLYSHLVARLYRTFRWQRWAGGAPKVPPRPAPAFEVLFVYLCMNSYPSWLCFYGSSFGDLAERVMKSESCYLWTGAPVLACTSLFIQAQSEGFKSLKDTSGGWCHHTRE